MDLSVSAKTNWLVSVRRKLREVMAGWKRCQVSDSAITGPFAGLSIASYVAETSAKLPNAPFLSFNEARNGSQRGYSGSTHERIVIYRAIVKVGFSRRIEPLLRKPECISPLFVSIFDMCQSN